MLRRLDIKLILSLTVLIVAISCVGGYVTFRMQKQRLVETMVTGADQLSRSITSATWHAMLADDRASAYEIMRVIADKHGVDRIRMFNREGQLTFSTDTQEKVVATSTANEVCISCHKVTPILAKPAFNSRVRYATSPEGIKTLNIVTPIYNEPSCSNASCHAHSASTEVLGVLDVALRLDPVQQQTSSVTLQAVITTASMVLVGAAFVILFTRRFVATPIRELINGTKVLSVMKLDHPVTISHRSQELDELVDSFNGMRERLKVAVDELNEMKQTLESKVAERGKQLQVAHRKLLQADRLASLGQLSASVAHEINNPISGVLNLSTLLERLMANGAFPAGREAEFQKYLGRISAETARVGRIVSDLLAFSRRSKPQRVPADLNKLVISTVGLVSHKLKMNNAEAVLDLQPDLPQVECDPSQMQQVILNLTMNGAEAMQPKGGGQLTVRTRLLPEDDCVELCVIDTGEGISPENLSKIYDPFFTTKAEGKGVGLGLTVLYGIVKAHDGEVEVTSTKNEGTTFTVTIPLKPRSSAPQQREVQVHGA
ncbi:MAG TPA: ATP-binding protein [Candidatus Saccharimonadales bacterium]|nr:ATP-binding protein [Candidatus Saccharimonadales bacterium]